MSEKLNPGYQERAADLREIAAAIRSDDSLNDDGIREIIMNDDDADTCDLAAACIEACVGDPARVEQMVKALECALNDRMYKDWPEIADLILAALGDPEQS